MDLDPKPDVRREVGTGWQAVWSSAARLPGKALVVLGVFLLVAGVMALHTALTRKDSSLRLKVEHNFRSAQLWVWLDDDEVYSGRLIGSGKTIESAKPIVPRRPLHSRKKRQIEWVESVEGSLSETFMVSSGPHEVRVRVANEENGSVQENAVRGDFLSDGLRTLSVVARGNDVLMNWQGENQATASAPNPVSGPAKAPEGWLQRYAGSVFVSVIGSIISAVTGYAIRELPRKIKPQPAKARSASAGQ